MSALAIGTVTRSGSSGCRNSQSLELLLQQNKKLNLINAHEYSPSGPPWMSVSRLQKMILYTQNNIACIHCFQKLIQHMR